MTTDLFDDISTQANSLRAQVATAAQGLRDFTRRLELILSQDHKNMTIRDGNFAQDFSQFCTQLRKQTDDILQYWQQTRETLRTIKPKDQRPSSLQAKSFALRAKTLSRATDDFTTAYDCFNSFYKNYTLSKLPVWVLTSCCDDLNNLTGKILFLAREVSKKSEGGTTLYGAR